MNWKTMLVVISVALNVGLVVYLCVAPGAPTIFVNQAGAQNRAITAGQYVATTADFNSSRAALWVIDNKEKRMLAYAFPSAITGGGARQLMPIGGRDLRKDFGENLSGDLTMLPGRIQSDIEVVYVFDSVGKVLMAYASRNGKDVEFLAKRDLEKDFREGK